MDVFAEKEREDWEVQEKLRMTREKVAERLKECRQKKLIFERKQVPAESALLFGIAAPRPIEV